MRPFIGAILVTVVASGLSGSARADDAKDPQAILDKAIKALGGEEKLSKVKAASWKAKGTIKKLAQATTKAYASRFQDENSHA